MLDDFSPCIVAWKLCTIMSAADVTATLELAVEPHVFEKVQSFLKERNPRVASPRMVSGPALLTGLAVCATCHGAMTLRTGISKTGQVHRCYACSTCARHGKSVCKGRSIRMDKLDTLIVDQLIDRLLKPQRLNAMPACLENRRAAKAKVVDPRIIALEREAHEAGERLRRLYQAIEEGAAEMDDILKDRITVGAALDAKAVAAGEGPAIVTIAESVWATRS